MLRNVTISRVPLPSLYQSFMPLMKDTTLSTVADKVKETPPSESTVTMTSPLSSDAKSVSLTLDANAQ
jgi:hypothetical protein